MSKQMVKFIIFIAALGVLAPVGWFGFRLMGDFIAAFNSGANPASIFHGNSLIVPDSRQARWLTVDPEGKAPTQGQLEELIAAYYGAWEALARAHATGDPSDLPTYWAGAALDSARAATMGTNVAFEHERHRLRLSFLSNDGSVARIHDERFIYRLDGIDLTATSNAVLTLDNGFWRIRQYNIDFQ